MERPFDADDRESPMPESGTNRTAWFGRAVDLRMLVLAILVVFGALAFIAPIPLWALVLGAVAILALALASPPRLSRPIRD